MTVLYVIWQDADTRAWYPVGRLSHDGRAYRFVYTKGANRSANFKTFGRMNQLHTVYHSEELFPLFANRLLRKSRPEYADYLRWLGLDEVDHEPMQELARTGGLRQTDPLVIYPRPERTPRGYECTFFSHGLRYLDSAPQERAAELQSGEILYPVLDVTNPKDSNAVGLITAAPSWFVGYVPRYRAPDVRMLLLSPDAANMTVHVDRYNHDAPSQLRVLCRIEADWPEEFTPCQDADFRVIDASDETVAA